MRTFKLPERDARVALARHEARARRPAWRRPLAMVGLVIMCAWIIVALLAPWIAPHDPFVQAGQRFEPPSAAHWFGTDGLGRDVLSRVVHGARISVFIPFLLVGLAASIGGLLGAVAGYFGGLVDEIIMRLADLVFAFPMIILAMAVVAALGPGLRNAVIAVAIVAWPSFARVVRSLVISHRERDYVHASRLLGSSSRRALAVEIAPNIVGPVFVLATLELGVAVLIVSALSFLGLGVQPPAAEWGSMVAVGAREFDRWWTGFFAGLAIFSLVLAFNLLGDAMRDRLDRQSAAVVRE